MINYEVEMEQWPYKGTDKALLDKGFNAFWFWYPKKVRKALWKYDVWDNLCNADRIAYIQTWADATNDMHSYPFTSLDELAEYLIKEEGYSYRDLVTLGYDSVNTIDPNDDIWVWEYDCSLRSYSRWTDFMQDFDEYEGWDNFISWATNVYKHSARVTLKLALKSGHESLVHLDYIELLGDYFGPFLEKLTGDKRDWFIRRIKSVYQIGEDDAEKVLLGKKEEEEF